jgi:hypothetical protein
MDPFSYLVVLTSIVIGLGVTRLVGGFGHLLSSRRRGGNYWVHMLWMINLFLTMTIVWWFAYRWRSNEHWTFFIFLWLLLGPTLLYLIASLLFPGGEDLRAVTDWRTYYYENSRDIFLLWALLFPIDILDTLLKGLSHFHEQGAPYFITMTLWFAVCLIAAFTKRPRFHAFAAVAFLIYNLALLGATLITDQGTINWIPVR